MSEGLTDEQRERWAETVAQANPKCITHGAWAYLDRDIANAVDAELTALRQRAEAAEFDARTAWLRVEEACEVVERLEGERDAARAQVAALREHLASDEALLAERNRLLAAIPPCPEHGGQCVPHAIEWVEAERDALRQRAEAAEGALRAVDENQRRQLEALGLLGRFVPSTDLADHMGEALLTAEAQVASLAGALRQYADPEDYRDRGMGLGVDADAARAALAALPRGAAPRDVPEAGE